MRQRYCRIKTASGFWLLALNTLSCDGLTMPWRTIYLRPEYRHDNGLITHELAHIDQIMRLGAWRFSLRYLYELARYGYWNMPLEIEARNYTDRNDDSISVIPVYR